MDPVFQDRFYKTVNENEENDKSGNQYGRHYKNNSFISKQMCINCHTSVYRRKKGMPSAVYKAVTNAFDGNDLDRRVLFQVATQLSNIYIEVAAVEKRIAAPQQGQDLCALYDLVAVFVKQLK